MSTKGARALGFSPRPFYAPSLDWPRRRVGEEGLRFINDSKASVTGVPLLEPSAGKLSMLDVDVCIRQICSIWA